MTDQPVAVREDDGVTVVQLQDGKVNALSREMLSTLGDHLEKAVAQGQPVVITGQGKAFSAGLDLKEVPVLDRDGMRDLFHRFERVLRTILEAQVPVVAGVNGFAVAGGAIIALACDLRVGHPEAEIGATELEVGIPFPPQDTALFTARLPPQTIRNTVLTPRKVRGEEAVERGWIDLLAEDAGARAVDVARHMTGPNPVAFCTLKGRLNEPILAAMDETTDELEEAFLDSILSDETKEGVLKGIQAVMSK